VTVAAPLPRILVTWNQSSVSEAEFVCYRVYRRRAGETAWTLRAQLGTRTRTQWEDFFAHSRVTYEYTVTQVALVGADEVESNPSATVSAALVIRSAFIHVVGSEATYAELQPEAQGLSDSREVAVRRVWGLESPVAVISPGSTLEVELRGRETWDGSGKTWRALGALLAAQAAGRQLYGRQDRWGGAVVLYGPQRTDGPATFDWAVRLAIVAFEEASA